jgi:hypothetical protein
LLHRGQEAAHPGARDVGPEHGSVAGDHDERVAERHDEAVLRVETDQGAAELEDRPELPVHDVGAVDQPVVADDDQRVAERRHEAVLGPEADPGAPNWKTGPSCPFATSAP